MSSDLSNIVTTGLEIGLAGLVLNNTERMLNPMVKHRVVHFKSKADYMKWNAFRNIHHVKKGEILDIHIAGKHHKVIHNLPPAFHKAHKKNLDSIGF